VDDVSIIFVRQRPESADLIRRFGVQCKTAPISAPAIASNASSPRSSAERFQYLMNAASMEYLLSRDSEVSANLGEAERIFSDEPNLHLLKAQLAQAHNQLEEAERQYKIALGVRPTDTAWYALAGLYASEHRYSEALHCVLESAAMSPEDYDRYRALGKLYLAMNQPQDALAAFEKASRKSPFQGGTAQLGVEFNAKLAEGESAAYSQMGDKDRAVISQSEAVRLTPSNATRWQVLADLYQAAGRIEDASNARQHAVGLQPEHLVSHP
jgi:tetratricopeptide (TPR) repeat protein